MWWLNFSTRFRYETSIWLFVKFYFVKRIIFLVNIFSSQLIDLSFLQKISTFKKIFPFCQENEELEKIFSSIFFFWETSSTVLFLDLFSVAQYFPNFIFRLLNCPKIHFPLEFIFFVKNRGNIHFRKFQKTFRLRKETSAFGFMASSK